MLVGSTDRKEGSMIHALARVRARVLALAARLASDQRGQGTVEYVGLAMAVGVLLLAVSSYLGGHDHGLGSVITGAIKSAVQRAAGGGK
jgi:Flp pilus assembly pilin Flp